MKYPIRYPKLAFLGVLAIILAGWSFVMINEKIYESAQIYRVVCYSGPAVIYERNLRLINGFAWSEIESRHGVLLPSHAACTYTRL